MSRKEKLPLQEDDGHVIAPMNVDGMPWYRPDNPGNPGFEHTSSSGSDLSPEERRLAVWGAVRTGLIIFAVFATVFLLFLLFADYLWFGN